MWLWRLAVDPPRRPRVAPPRIGHFRCGLEMAPAPTRCELADLNSAFLDCCPIVGDESQVKVERPQRSEDERP